MRVDPCGPLEALMYLPEAARPQVAAADALGIITEDDAPIGFFSTQQMPDGSHYVCFASLITLRLHHLKQLREWMPATTLVARVIGTQAERFAEFFGFRKTDIEGVLVR